MNTRKVGTVVLYTIPPPCTSLECATKTGMILIFGEISSNAILDYQKIIRETIKEIGYDDSKIGISLKY